MSLLKGKQIATGADGVNTANIVDGALAASAGGRAKMAASFFDTTTTTDAKFAAASINLNRLAEAVIQADGGQAFTADQSMGSNKLTSLSDGTAASDAVNKGQLDNAVAGLSWKDSVKASTTADIVAANTYANGTAGVGATLTKDTAGAWLSSDSDGVTLVQFDRLLVKDQAAGLENGIYELTVVGDGLTPWELTRVTDADVSLELDSAAVFIQQGAVNGDNGFTQTADAPTIGTTALTFVQFTGAGSVSFGASLQTVSATSTNGAGSGTDAARDNHTHALSTAAQSVTIQSDAGTPTAGSAASVLRTDAQLTAVTAAPVGLGAANAQGASTSLARANHVHARDVENQEVVTAEAITGTDTAITDTLNSTPVNAASVQLYLNGLLQQQGAGFDYTISGSTITWLASTGTAVDLEAGDLLIAKYIS